MNEYDNELSKIVAELNRAAPSQKYATTRMGQATPSLDQLLQAAAGRGASDVLLIAGAPAMLRVTGNLTAGAGAVLEAGDVRSLVLPLLEPSQLEELQKRKSVDLSFVRENLGRFRINIHHQRGTLAASIRLCLRGFHRSNCCICRDRWRNSRSAGRGWCWSRDRRAAARAPRWRR